MIRHHREIFHENIEDILMQKSVIKEIWKNSHELNYLNDDILGIAASISRTMRSKHYIYLWTN